MFHEPRTLIIDNWHAHLLSSSLYFAHVAPRQALPEVWALHDAVFSASAQAEAAKWRQRMAEGRGFHLVVRQEGSLGRQSVRGFINWPCGWVFV